MVLSNKLKYFSYEKFYVWGSFLSVSLSSKRFKSNHTHQLRLSFRISLNGFHFNNNLFLTRNKVTSLG